jgi:hypothetical protein
MKQEEALKILVQVCEKANKAGVFTLSESSLVLQALESFGVTAPKAEKINDSEDKKEQKK